MQTLGKEDEDISMNIDTLFDGPLWRSRSHEIITGAAGGLGEKLGVSPWAIRLGLAILSVAAGLGVLVYVLLVLASAKRTTDDVPQLVVSPSQRRSTGFVVLCIGLLFLLGGTLEPTTLTLLFPLILIAAGSAVVWARADDDGQEQLRRNPAAWLVGGRGGVWRVGLGLILFALGMSLVVLDNASMQTMWRVMIGMLQLTAGLAILVGPGVARLWNGFTAERNDRMRSDARAEVSAHLHDSVLNTLALLQRLDDVNEMKSLARTQERELRAWMQGRSQHDSDTYVDDALRAMASAIERERYCEIDVVVVGAHVELNGQTTSMLDAAKEAMTNAAKHAGVQKINVYAECDHGELTIFVRDDGVGFDVDGVDGTRQGIRESIVGRMERVGGTAKVSSTMGEGTEVELHAKVAE